MTYAIFGATGHTGGAAVRHLLRRGAPVRAILRDGAKGEALRREGAEIALAAAEDEAALVRALSGVAGAYLMIPPTVGAADFLAAADRTGAALAGAAKAAGVPYVVALSSIGAHAPEGVIASLAAFERRLAEAGIDRTILRPGYFTTNWAGVAGLAKAEGVLPSLLQPLDRRTAMIAPDDIGAAAAEALLAPAKGARVVNLAGPRDYSPDDAAAAFAAALRREVKAVAPPAEAWRGILVGAGLGESYADGLVAMYHAINAGRLGFPPDEPVTRGETTLDAAIAPLA